MNVDPVDYQSSGDPLLGEQGADRPRLAVVQGRHGVEKMGDMCDTPGEGGHRLFVCRRGMSEGDYDSFGPQGFDDRSGTGQLGCHGHHQHTGGSGPTVDQIQRWEA
jgi:hypothetical protein